MYLSFSLSLRLDIKFNSKKECGAFQRTKICLSKTSMFKFKSKITNLYSWTTYIVDRITIKITHNTVYKSYHLHKDVMLCSYDFMKSIGSMNIRLVFLVFFYCSFTNKPWMNKRSIDQCYFYDFAFNLLIKVNFKSMTYYCYLNL